MNATGRKMILVTGGAGFVGGILAHQLLVDGHEVVVVDDLSNGRKENVPEDAYFHVCDLADARTLEVLDQYPIEVVIHCAAQSSNAISFEAPVADLYANQLATLNILLYCKTKSIRRFIFTSSMSCYGEAEEFPTPETTCCYPDSFYAVHKLASEHYVRIFSQEYGFETTIFRLYTTYGFGQNLENVRQGLLSIYLSYLLHKKTLVVKGAGERIRDIVHVEDVVRAIRLSIERAESIGKTYNLATQESVTIQFLIDNLVAGLGLDPAVYPVEWEKGTPGDPFKTHGSIEAARKDLGWEPQISVIEGVRRTLLPYITPEEVK